MPPVYRDTIPAYAVGRRVNSEEWNGISRTLAGATAVGFGVPVIHGTAEHTVAPLTAAAEAVAGITEANFVLPHTGDEYQQYDTVAICESGVIGVLLGANVTKGAQARFNVTNKTWTGATASATVLTIPGATFDEAGVSGAVGVVRYRKPNPSLSASS
jgi:hypothetical protein